MHKTVDTRYTQERELSWLRFDSRVLDEARDESVPLFERLKFAAIFTSNLDEFFMIRVGSIYDMSLPADPCGQQERAHPRGAAPGHLQDGARHV